MARRDRLPTRGIEEPEPVHLRIGGQDGSQRRQQVVAVVRIELAALDQVGHELDLNLGWVQMALDVLDQGAKQQAALVLKQLDGVAPVGVERDREHARDRKEHETADAKAEIGGDRRPAEPPP